MTRDTDRQVVQLVNAACDERLNADDALTLQSLVVSSPQQALRYLGFCELHASLIAILGQDNRGDDQVADDRLATETRRWGAAVEGSAPHIRPVGCDGESSAEESSVPLRRRPSCAIRNLIAAVRTAWTPALAGESRDAAGVIDRPFVGIYWSSISREPIADGDASVYFFAP